MRECKFVIGGNVIENVTSYSHLGHIIDVNFDDVADVKESRNPLPT
jgi:hypothetical protein